MFFFYVQEHVDQVQHVERVQHVELHWATCFGGLQKRCIAMIFSIYQEVGLDEYVMQFSQNGKLC